MLPILAQNTQAIPVLDSGCSLTDALLPDISATQQLLMMVLQPEVVKFACANMPVIRPDR